MNIHTNQQKSPSDLVYAAFAAFGAGNRAVMEDLLHQDFTFTSPYDNHIGKTDYFERCWPHRDQIKAHNICKIFEKQNEALVIYEATGTDGYVFRNVELFVFAIGDTNNKIQSIEVFFGREIK